MKKIITLIVLLAVGTSAMAQVRVTGYGLSSARSTNKSDGPKESKEYRFNMNNSGLGLLLIEMDNVTVEGYDGTEVIINMFVAAKKEDERAAGLVGINRQGLRDNTGMGINVEQSEGLAQIRMLNARKGKPTVIKVPRQVTVSVSSPRSFDSGPIVIKDIRGGIEISAIYNNINLQHITGPMTVKTVDGNIEAILNEPVKGPVSIITTYGLVDIALPAQVKADIELATSFGNLFVSEAFNIQIEEKEETAGESSGGSSSETSVRTSGDGRVIVATGGLTLMGNEVNLGRDSTTNNLTYTISGRPSAQNLRSTSNSNKNALVGSINGGGENIFIRATDGNIYLRTTERQ